MSTPIGFSDNDDLLGSRGGSIFINIPENESPAKTIELLDGGRIGAEAVGGGFGGEVQIRADDILISGINRSIDVMFFPLELKDFDGLSSIGSLSLQIVRNRDFLISAVAADAINTSGDFSEGIGDAGKIALTIGNELTVTDGARVATFSDVDQGNAGDISVTADQRIIVSDGAEITSASLNDNTDLKSGTADAGIINLQTPLLQIDRGAIIATTINGEGGTISLDAGTLNISNGGKITATTTGTGIGGSIFIHGNQLSLLDDAVIASDVGNGAAGKGGGVTVEMATLELIANDGATPAISTTTTGSGQGGNLNIMATQSIQIESAGGFFVDSRSAEEGAPDGGKAGSITVMTPDFSMSGGTLAASTATTGIGGSISIVSDNLLMNDGATIIASTTSVAKGGEVMLDVNNLNMLNADVSVETSGSGTGGNITADITNIMVMAGNSQLSGETLDEGIGGNITIIGNRLAMLDNAEITSDVGNAASGKGGTVTIDVGTLELVGRGGPAPEISTETFGTGAGGDLIVTATESIRINSVSGENAAGIFTNANVSDMDGGNAGAIELNTADFSMNGGQIAASTATAGAGRSVTVNANQLQLNDGALIEARSTGSGNAGDINLNAGRRFELVDSNITTGASQSFGGNINITTDGVVDAFRGTVSTSVATGIGSGGDVNFTGPQIALNKSTIIARADAGNGGNIRVAANQFFRSPDTVIDASANTGIDGEVLVDAPDVIVENSLASLPASFLNVASLIRPSCDIAGAAEAGGEFVVSHRRGLPASSEELLASFNADWTDDIPVDSTQLLAADTSTAELRDPRGITEAAQTAFRAGRYEEAAESYIKLANISTRGDASVLQSEALRGLGEAQHAQGKFGQALGTLRNAIAHAKDAGGGTLQAEILGCIGNTLVALGKRAEAEQVLKRGLALITKNEEPIVAAGIANNLGNVYAMGQNWELALERYKESAELAEQAGAQGPAALALSSASRAAINAGSNDYSARLAGQAHNTLKMLPESHARVAISIHLAKTYEKLAAASDSNRATALLQSHALLKSAMGIADVLVDDRSQSLALGNLAGLYQTQNRLDEALYLNRGAIRAAEHADATDVLCRWHWQSGQLLWKLNNHDAAIESYRRAVYILQETRQEVLARYGSTELQFKHAVAPVYQSLVSALLEISTKVAEPERTNELLREARDTVEQMKAAELRDYFQNECVTELESKRKTLDTLTTKAAVVYPILLSDRTELLISMDGKLTRYPIKATSIQVEETARRLRHQLQRNSADYLTAAQTLYKWLIDPWVASAENQAIETLVFVPDGALRSVPMAVLHDGERYLMQRFSLAVTPGLNLIDPKPLDMANVRMLAAGISKSVRGFPELKNVPAELEAVTEAFDGELLLNAEFQVAQVEEVIAEQRPNIVHIASHGIFTGDPETSFLLAYDGELTMERLADAVSVAKFRDDSLELLVLSACETADGDDRASLGLAGVAIRAGARSAVGSLWNISDEAAYRLVLKFYEELKVPGTSKAKALQKAQLNLLKTPKTSHPYFWSPFLLISNWL